MLPRARPHVARPKKNPPARGGRRVCECPGFDVLSGQRANTADGPNPRRAGPGLANADRADLRQHRAVSISGDDFRRQPIRWAYGRIRAQTALRHQLTAISSISSQTSADSNQLSASATAFRAVSGYRVSSASLDRDCHEDFCSFRLQAEERRPGVGGSESKIQECQTRTGNWRLETGTIDVVSAVSCAESRELKS